VEKRKGEETNRENARGTAPHLTRCGGRETTRGGGKGKQSHRKDGVGLLLPGRRKKKEGEKIIGCLLLLGGGKEKQAQVWRRAVDTRESIMLTFVFSTGGGREGKRVMDSSCSQKRTITRLELWCAMRIAPFPERGGGKKKKNGGGEKDRRCAGQSRGRLPDRSAHVLMRPHPSLHISLEGGRREVQIDCQGDGCHLAKPPR